MSARRDIWTYFHRISEWITLMHARTAPQITYSFNFLRRYSIQRFLLKAADSAGNGPILCNCSALMLPSSPRYQNIKTSDRWVSSTLGVATGSSLTATILLWLALQSSCSFPFQMSSLSPDAVLDLGRIQVVMALQGAEVGKIITISSFCLIGGSSFTC